jgi:hypothetical protein
LIGSMRGLVIEAFAVVVTVESVVDEGLGVGFGVGNIVLILSKQMPQSPHLVIISHL